MLCPVSSCYLKLVYMRSGYGSLFQVFHVRTCYVMYFTLGPVRRFCLVRLGYGRLVQVSPGYARLSHDRPVYVIFCHVRSY
jgi:hypothetical protein